LGVQPWNVAKFSGIGCSSKSPAYFLGLSHGSKRSRANAVGRHRRHARQSHGSKVLESQADGDTASIGMASSCNLLRRNLPFIYIIEDNGVYGLTRGSFRPPRILDRN